MAGGNAVKIGIIVVALAVVIAVVVASRKKDGPQFVEGKGPATHKDLVCMDTMKHFQMPIADYDAKAAEAKANQPQEQQSGPRPRGRYARPTLIPCDECDGGYATLAEKCPNSDTWYPIRNADGSKGRCPDQ